MRKLLMAMMLAGLAAAALADVSFSYSGQLRNETGGPVAEKSPKITFSLYNVATGGAALWSRLIPVLLDDNGYFVVELSNASGTAVGAETKLETVLAQNATLYVGLNVENSSGEISPRQKLVSTPRAAVADDVQTAKQDFTVRGTATLVNGLKVGDAKNLKAEFKPDGELVARKLTVSTESTSSGIISATTLDAAIVQQDGKTLIPKGFIMMWCGTTAPAGWALCNGSNGTPDLRGRFIVGYDPNDKDYRYVGTTGGEKNVTLTVDQMPDHTHDVKFPWRKCSGYGKTSRDCAAGWNASTVPSDARTWSNSAVPVGGDQSHENLPPYYALAYIMKL